MKQNNNMSPICFGEDNDYKNKVHYIYTRDCTAQTYIFVKICLLHNDNERPIQESKNIGVLITVFLR